MTSILNNIEIGFWYLLLNTSKIEIPIIQRDYAQGRYSEKTNKIRALFLNSIIDAIESHNGSLELDFVYGNVENDVFQPLDGQQRLTTLFLLHWYIALKTGNLSINKKYFLRFTYETRFSSREFCYELVEKGENLGIGETISERIFDSSWFFLAWGKDPTIRAMLTMLDSIDERLKAKNQEDLDKYWRRLTSENPPIKFHFKMLSDIGLTDDLYIKMNARGKALTDFESFKARFEKHIEKNKWETNITTPTNTFSHRVDTIWTDLFWKHRGSDNQTDNEFIKFVAGIAICIYAQNKEIANNAEDEQNTRKDLEGKIKGKITDETVKTERLERKITRLFNNPADVSPEDFTMEKSFEYLKKSFDIYSKDNNDELLPNDLPLWDIIDNKQVMINSKTEVHNSLFIEFIKDAKTEYKQRVLFYAQTQYLFNSGSFNDNFFSDWMRVVRNIVQNSTIDSAAAFIGAIGLINELSSGCSDIYQYLAKNTIRSGFASVQTKEEILKSSIIVINPHNKSFIFSIEDTNFFKGKITFALYCINYKSATDVFNQKLLSSIIKIVNEYLNENDISNKFRSALFTIRDNQFYTYWSSWSYGTNSKKRCLIENTSDLKSNFTLGYYSDYLKDLMLGMVNTTLDDIIRNYSCPQLMPNWKCRLIKDPQLLDQYCQSHFIGIPNDNTCCFLFYDKKRPSSRQECKRIE